MSENLMEPFARWESISACKAEQTKIGHTATAAETICMGIQERARKGELFKSASNLDILKSEGDELVVGGIATWELVDPQNDLITTEGMVNFLAKFFKLPEEYRNISIDHGSLIIGKALLQYPENEPKHFSHVHEKGMYLITKIRNDDLSYTKEFRQQIRDGIYKMYSIRGKAINPQRLLIDNVIVRKVFDIDPIEVAIVKEGMCPKAGPIEILKQQFLLEKKIEMRNGKYCVIHCHGPEAGTPIKCFDTKEEAEAMHRAIEANKSLEKDDRPPKDWFDNCTSRASGFADNPEAFCNALWHEGPPEKREAFGKSADKSFLFLAEQIFKKHFPNYKSDE